MIPFWEEAKTTLKCIFDLKENSETFGDYMNMIDTISWRVSLKHITCNDCELGDKDMETDILTHDCERTNFGHGKCNFWENHIKK